jgi:hypothetical protein
MLYTLALAGALSCASARAAFIDFVALPAGHTNGITVGATTLAGVDLGVASVVGEGTPANDGTGPAIPGGRLDFTTGTYTSVDAAGNLYYGPGGSITVSDANGVLFSGQFTGTTELLLEAGGMFKILAAGFSGQVNPALDTFFGLSTGEASAGTLSLNFAVGQTSLSFLSGDISVDPNPQGPPAAAPEPASMALVALGLPVALCLARRSRKKTSA